LLRTRSNPFRRNKRRRRRRKSNE